MLDRISTGKLGEKLARKYLAKNGYKIIARNVRYKFGELDIVAQKGGFIIFIEVKTMRKDSIYGDPGEKVNAKKLKRIQCLAELFLIKNRFSETQSWQIDVVSLELDCDIKKAKLVHRKDV